MSISGAELGDCSSGMLSTLAQNDEPPPTSLLATIAAIYNLVSSLARNIPAWFIQIYSCFLGNFLFFLFVFKGLLRELWCAVVSFSKSSPSTQGTIHTRRVRGGTSNVPNLVCPDTGDDSTKDADYSGVGDTEWFLSDESFPESTAAERARFLRARNGDVQAACAMLKGYLVWRKQFDALSDEQIVCKSRGGDACEEDPDWSKACRMAATRCSSTPVPLRTIPPCILFMPERNGDTTTPTKETLRPRLRTLDGKRVLQHLPARIDLSVAGAQLYATALALYIDQCVSRDSMEKICVIIDTRPGKGWGNIPAPKLIPFIKHAARLLNDLHPERLARCILFPVPSVAKFIWNAVKPFLDPDTAEKICILSGSAGMKAPVPRDMESYLHTDLALWMEQKRLSTFDEGPIRRKLEEKLKLSAR